MNLKNIRSILGIVKTTWRWGTSRRSVSRIHSPHSPSRLAWHDGQNPRVLHENIRRCSVRQRGQRIRANPLRGLPQSRYFSTTNPGCLQEVAPRGPRHGRFPLGPTFTSKVRRLSKSLPLQLIEKAPNRQRFDAVLSAKRPLSQKNHQSAADTFKSRYGFNPFKVRRG